MTPALQQKLSAIKEACQRAIELGEKPSGMARREIEPSIIYFGNDLAGQLLELHTVNPFKDGQRITFYHTFSPAAAKGLLGMIEAHEKAIEIASQILRIPWRWDGDGGANGIAEDIIENSTEALESLAASWGEGLK